MKFNLTGKTAVFTGGVSGIGKAISVILAEQGANVQILEMNIENAINAVEEIQKNGGKQQLFNAM